MDTLHNHINGNLQNNKVLEEKLSLDIERFHVHLFLLSFSYGYNICYYGPV